MTPAEVLTVPIQAGEIIVVVDRWVSKIAGGGIRFTEGVDDSELRHLARTMSLKYGFVNFPMGGAKTGISAPPPDSSAARTTLLQSVGRALRPFANRYFPGRDVGFDAEDLAVVVEAMKLRPGPAVDTGAYTGFALAIATEEWARSQGRKLRGLRVAVEGFGAVGSSVARHVVHRGCRLVGVSNAAGARTDPSGLDPTALASARRLDGEGFLEAFPVGRFSNDPIALLATECDILLLCGLSWSLNRETAGLLSCSAVIPGANCPATERARRVLEDRGIALLPDFACNCGGIAGSAFERLGLRPQEVEAVLDTDLRMLLRSLLSGTTADGSGLDEQARRIALRNIERRAGVRESMWVAMRPAISRAWNGSAPPSLLRAFAVPILRRTLRSAADTELPRD